MLAFLAQIGLAGIGIYVILVYLGIMIAAVESDSLLGLLIGLIMFLALGGGAFIYITG